MLVGSCCGLLSLLYAEPAMASGGGPLLLLFDLPAFTVGQVLVVVAEYVLLRRFVPGRGRKRVLGDVIRMNIVSAGLVGLLLPSAVSAIGYAGSLVPGGGGALAAALGAWVVENSPFAWVAVTSAFGWLVVQFPLIVVVEARVLTRRWRRAGVVAVSDAARAVLVVNGITYLGMLIVTVGVWRELLWT